MVKVFSAINPDGPSDAPVNPRYKPRTFDVTIKMVEGVDMSELLSHFKKEPANPMKVVQALDVATRHLGAQRLVSVGRNFFSMKGSVQLKGGKELCWGYHQSVRIGQERLLLNVNQAATAFYAPSSLLDVVMGALKLRSLNEYRDRSRR